MNRRTSQLAFRRSSHRFPNYESPKDPSNLRLSCFARARRTDDSRLSCQEAASFFYRNSPRGISSKSPSAVINIEISSTRAISFIYFVILLLYFILGRIVFYLHDARNVKIRKVYRMTVFRCVLQYQLIYILDHSVFEAVFVQLRLRHSQQTDERYWLHRNCFVPFVEVVRVQYL